MKKIILLLLPLFLILSCESDEEDASLVGTWNVQSVTNYEGTNCADNPEVTTDLTGTVTYSESVVTIDVNNILSFTSFCDDIEGTIVNDTTCSSEGFDFTISDFASLCNEEDGELDANNNCNLIWSEEYDYTYDSDTGEYCETWTDEDGYSETDCGTLSISGNNLTIQMIYEDECTVIELSK